MSKKSALPDSLRDLSERPYPPSTIWINGRHVSIEKVVQEKEVSRTPFEVETFHFIKSWISGEVFFEITTSGSTGKPKVISISRMQMTASAWRTAQKIDLQSNMRALVCIDTKYIGGKMMLARSMTLGLQLVAVEPSANPLVSIPVDECVQFTAFVPYQVSAILESKHPHLLNNLQKVLIGGAPLNADDRQRLDRFQCQCYETYGMTETVSHIALRLINTKAKQSYFETLPGIEIARDPRGCLVVSADYLPDTVTTNDLVEIVAPDKFLWLGRWDSVINTGGVKVIPEKVEKVIETIFFRNNFNHRFFIAALADEKLGNKVVLILEGVQFSSEILQQSLALLRSSVSSYEYPKEIHTIPEFRMTATHKIDRPQTLAGVTILPSSL